jgi:hypothetical protein
MMMAVRTWFTHLTVLAACTTCTLTGAGCGHRQTAVTTNAATKVTPIAPATSPVLAAVVPATAPSSTVSATTAAALKTYHCPTADLQFDYPADWETNNAHTALFAVCKDQCSLNLDIPKLPWHPPGMITLKMVASGYEDDLKKNQLHDAVEEEDCPLQIPGAKACRITTCGHDNGKAMFDIAVVMVHADRVYILSADCDESSEEKARKTLDEAVGSLKWAK